MPLFVYALVGALVSAAGTLVGRVLIALGITAVTYVGVGASLDWMVAQWQSSLGNLPGKVLSVLGALRVGYDVGILVGAITARLTLAGLTSDSLTFWVMRGKI